MLIIRDQQMQAFREAALADELRAYLLAHHAGAARALPAPELARVIAEGIRRAPAYTLTWQSSIGWFVATMLEVSPRFDAQPRIRALLEDRSCAESEKIERLLRGTDEQDWREAQSS